MTDFAKLQSDLCSQRELPLFLLRRAAADAIGELYTEILRLEAKLREEPCVVEEHTQLEQMLREMTSQDGCTYDHDMYCQTPTGRDRVCTSEHEPSSGSRR